MILFYRCKQIENSRVYNVVHEGIAYKMLEFLILSIDGSTISSHCMCRSSNSFGLLKSHQTCPKYILGLICTLHCYAYTL
jgi:hypothetical protein